MGRGGARWGAGAPRQRDRAEWFPRLEVQRLHRAGHLRDGVTSYYDWSRRGEVTACARITADADELRVNFDPGGAFTVPLSRVPCRYGGTRAWFVCPRCARRCGVLYLNGGRLQCRRCGHLVYSSQSQDEMERAWSKQHKIEMKLGSAHSKPARMHWRTYSRLIAQIEECRRRHDEALIGCAMAILRSR